MYCTVCMSWCFILYVVCTEMVAVQILVLMAAMGSPIGEYKLTNWRYVKRILLALSNFYLEQTVARVKNSPFFTISTDMSSDKANREQMLLYITYWDFDEMQPVTEFLCLARLLRKDAASIFYTVKVCDIPDLDMRNELVGFTADGDNTMQGWRTGVLGRLRRYCRHVLGMHCTAHREVLATSSAAKLSSLVGLADEALQAPYNLFNRKPNHFGCWELLGKSWTLSTLSFKMFNTTR